MVAHVSFSFLLFSFTRKDGESPRSRTLVSFWNSFPIEIDFIYAMKD